MQNITLGNLILLCIAIGNNDIRAGVADSAGNVYTPLIWNRDNIAVAAIRSLVAPSSPANPTATNITPINAGGTGVSQDRVFIAQTPPAPGPKGEILFNATQLSGGGGSTVAGSPANMFDANDLTSWTTSTSGAWVGIDCGAATYLTRVRVSPLGTYEDGIVGAEIQGSNDPTFVTGTANLFTIKSRGINGLLFNEYPISTGGLTYRYYRIINNLNTWIFADIDFIGCYTSGVSAQAAAPTITPPGGNFDLPIRVRISSLTLDASIYYTLDGSTPTTSSTLYTGPFTVPNSNTQVNAIAVSSSLGNSRITTSYFFCPSLFYSHQFRYDDRNFRLTSSTGCLFFDPIGKYWYNYLVCRNETPRGAPNGVNVYRSADLRNWKYMGVVCDAPAGAQQNSTMTLLGRCQVFYCATTSLYVMWGGDNVTKVVYTSTAPDASAPWTLVKTYTSTSPMADGYANSGDIGDLGSFIDDDGKIYIIYNHHSDSNTAFSQLDPATLTNTLGPGVNNASYTLVGEAHTVFKRGRTYFYMYSGLTGLNYNLNHYATASSPIGPWRGNTNPFQPNTSPPANLSFNSQTDQVIKIPGRGGDAYIWISDDLQPASNSEAFATKLIMPIVFTSSSTYTLRWRSGSWFDGTPCSPWNIDRRWRTVSGAPAAPSNLTTSGSRLSPALHWTNNELGGHMLYVDIANDRAFNKVIASELLAPGTTTFTDTVPPAGRKIYYRIRAVNASGTSSSKAVASGALRRVEKANVAKSGGIEKVGRPAKAGFKQGWRCDMPDAPGRSAWPRLSVFAISTFAIINSRFG